MHNAQIETLGKIEIQLQLLKIMTNQKAIIARLNSLAGCMLENEKLDHPSLGVKFA